MRKRRRPQRGLPDCGAIELKCDIFPDGSGVKGSELHKEVVWMLSVMKRQTVQTLAALQEQRISICANWRGRAAEDRAKTELATRQRMIRHEHDPVHAHDRTIPAVGLLIVETELEIPMQHQHPAARHEVKRIHRR